MREYLRETLKMLQAEHCEDAVSRKAVLELINGYGVSIEEAEEKLKGVLKDMDDGG